jgi:hypothetical protein
MRRSPRSLIVVVVVDFKLRVEDGNGHAERGALSSSNIDGTEWISYAKAPGLCGCIITVSTKRILGQDKSHLQCRFLQTY